MTAEQANDDKNPTNLQFHSPAERKAMEKRRASPNKICGSAFPTDGVWYDSSVSYYDMHKYNSFLFYNNMANAR